MAHRTELPQQGHQLEVAVREDLVHLVKIETDTCSRERQVLGGSLDLFHKLDDDLMILVPLTLCC